MNQQWRPPSGPNPWQQPPQRPQPQPWQQPGQWQQQQPQKPSYPPQSGGIRKVPKPKGNPTKKKKLALYILYGSAILTGLGFIATLVIYLMRY